MRQPHLDSIPVGEKTSDAKTPATDSSACKEKGLKYYIPEDPDSEPDPSDSSLIDSDFSNDSNYKFRRRHKKKKNRKFRKQDPIKLYVGLTEKLLTTEYSS